MFSHIRWHKTLYFTTVVFEVIFASFAADLKTCLLKSHHMGKAKYCAHVLWYYKVTCLTPFLLWLPSLQFCQQFMYFQYNAVSLNNKLALNGPHFSYLITHRPMAVVPLCSCSSLSWEWLTRVLGTHVALFVLLVHTCQRPSNITSLQKGISNSLP